ncbi:MAG TPA: HEAT repeat domain-containing protein [Streptosporangiaceae bacterium]|nr:HEAT repeat domain-containing protein [Streptosporangiaceae bacterium]
MVLTEMSADLTAADLVDALADPHRCFQAYQRLLRLGPQASVAARRGLRHPRAQVREYSCMVLDHLMDAESVPLLIAALDDPAERVRLAAAHALACDRCKEGCCRPEAAAVLPRAIALLAGDESAHVRAMAVEVVGQWVHSHPAACSAIERAAAHDPAPAVRKTASWYAPGGTVYRRTQPRPHRLRPS